MSNSSQDDTKPNIPKRTRTRSGTRSQNQTQTQAIVAPRRSTRNKASSGDSVSSNNSEDIPAPPAAKVPKVSNDKPLKKRPVSMEKADSYVKERKSRFPRLSNQNEQEFKNEDDKVNEPEAELEKEDQSPQLSKSDKKRPEKVPVKKDTKIVEENISESVAEQVPKANEIPIEEPKVVNQENNVGKVKVGKRQSNANQKDNDGRRSSNDFLANLMTSQKDTFHQQKQKPESQELPKDKTNDHVPTPSYNGEYVANAFNDNPNEYVKPNSDKNVNYSLWSLKPKANRKDECVLLLRGSVHGLLKGQRRNQNNRNTIASKLETQMPFGLERLSRKEIAYDWISALTKQSTLRRVRIGKMQNLELQTE